MSAIQNLQEPWNGHTNQEVEDFLKTKIQVVRFYFDSNYLLSNPFDDSGNSISTETLLAMLLRGPIFAVAYYTEPGHSLPRLTGILQYDDDFMGGSVFLRTAEDGVACMQLSGSCGGGCCGGCC